MPTLTVDGRPVTVPEGAFVLQAVRQAGVPLPTLCYLDGLPPYGACRLCLVEVVAPVSEIASPLPRVITACTHPASEGMVVHPHGAHAAAARRLLLEFLLARCPTSSVIRDLASLVGVVDTRFPSSGRPDELCILCGLCVRVCSEAVGAAAIGFIGRGMAREVGAPFRVQSEACIGCGACAAVCPTGAVRIEDADGQRVLHTWNTTVPLRPCPVCGLPFAPEPMAFLRGLAEASEHLWGTCPACRRKSAAAQFGVARGQGLPG